MGNLKKHRMLGATFILVLFGVSAHGGGVSTHYETPLSISDYENRIHIATRGYTDTAKSIVDIAIAELKAFNAGKRTRRDYGSNGIKIGKAFNWWCSEFSKAVIAQANLFTGDAAMQAHYDPIHKTSQLIAFFKRYGAALPRNDIAGHIEAGDYLALSKPYKNSPVHSTIVVYVDPQKRFVLTIDGNNHLNNAVRLHAREYLKTERNAQGTTTRVINPEFFVLGKTGRLVR